VATTRRRCSEHSTGPACATSSSEAGGGDFHTLTDLGILGLMQWVDGETSELEYADLAADPLSAEVLGN